MKDLVFKERLAKKLVDQYVGSYIIDKVVSTNIVKLQLLTSMSIYPVVNVSQVVQYKEQVEEQKVGEAKLVEVYRVKEWEIEKILNKRKIKGVVNYLVYWKEFIAKSNTWKKKRNLENTKEAVAEFKEKLDRVKKKNFRRRRLLGKYIAKILYR